jgi:hypothetical protein
MWATARGTGAWKGQLPAIRHQLWCGLWDLGGARDRAHEASKAIRGGQRWVIGSVRHGVHGVRVCSLLCNMDKTKNKLWVDFGYLTDNSRVGGNILIRTPRLLVGYEFDHGSTNVSISGSIGSDIQ